MCHAFCEAQELRHCCHAADAYRLVLRSELFNGPAYASETDIPTELDETANDETRVIAKGCVPHNTTPTLCGI